MPDFIPDSSLVELISTLTGSSSHIPVFHSSHGHMHVNEVSCVSLCSRWSSCLGTWRRIRKQMMESTGISNAALYMDVVDLRVTMMDCICIFFRKICRPETSLEFTCGTISEGAFAKFCRSSVENARKSAKIRFIASGKSAAAESFAQIIR